MFLATTGLAFLVVGFVSDRGSELPLAMGGLFLTLAVVYFYRMRQWVAAAETSSSSNQPNGSPGTTP